MAILQSDTIQLKNLSWNILHRKRKILKADMVSMMMNLIIII